MLLGSGVSRSAGIPTGWEVVLDLTRQIAAAENADPEPDPAEWYTLRFNQPPEYSAVLDKLAPLSAERQALLRGYFEATAEDQSEGIKSPTEAHRAIANLVAGGWVRVIVTTNFDRLIESSLEAVDVSPIVISTPDQARGAPPIAHSKCTLIKVHGDYLDTRIKNSEEELLSFDQSMDSLLDQVFDEYGLIVCGWSGEFDVALRRAMTRRVSRRYSTYWCVRGTPNEKSQRVLNHMQAMVVEIPDADSFFTDLSEQVIAIVDSRKSNPLDTRVAVETVKRYLPLPQYRIRLRELVRESTEGLVAQLGSNPFSVNAEVTNDEFLQRIKIAESISQRSLAMIANGSFWGSTDSDDAWITHVVRLAELEIPQNSSTVWSGVLRYPALLALYAAGVASVAARRYELLSSLFLAPCRNNQNSRAGVLVDAIHPYSVVHDNAAQLLLKHLGWEDLNYFTPLSQYLHQEVRKLFTDLVPADHAFTDSFDRFEYLASITNEIHSGRFFAQGGFLWRNRGTVDWLPAKVNEEIEHQGIDWLPFKSGFLGNSMDELLEAKRSVDRFAEKYEWM